MLFRDFRVGSWLVEPTLNRISEGEVTKHLEPKVMQVLVCLAETPARVVSKEELLSQIWPGTFVSDDVLLRCISELRKALADDVRNPHYVQTIPKSGYRLVAAVEQMPEQVPESDRSDDLALFPGRRPQARRWLLMAALLVAFVLTAVLVLWRERLPGVVKGQTNVLAVLPFVDLSGGADQAFFSDGLTEELITELGRLDPERVKVIARTSAMHYKNSRMRVDQIGKELGADFVVEGTVRVEGDRTRISARLIRTTDQSNLWTANYDRKISGILAVQTEVAREVASRLSLTLKGPAEKGSQARSVNPDAYMNYLKGRYHYHKFTTEGFIAATEYFQKAIQLDPQHAPSRLGLADAYRLRGSWWGDLPPQEAFPLAKEAASRALVLAPTLGEAHAALAWIRFVFDWDWSGAEAEFKRAVALSPNSRDTHSPYANYLRCMGRAKEAEVQIERSLEIDPLSPLELSEAGLVYIQSGELQKAERFIRQAVEVDPDFPGNLFAQAVLYGTRGELEQEIGALEKGVAVPRPTKMFQAHLAGAYLRAGKPERARLIIEQLLKTPSVSAGYLVGLYNRMGDDEKALDWLERAYEERDPLMVWLSQANPSHPLWKYPRFQKILRQMNFPESPAGS